MNRQKQYNVQDGQIFKLTRSGHNFTHLCSLLHTLTHTHTHTHIHTNTHTQNFEIRIPPVFEVVISFCTDPQNVASYRDYFKINR